MSESSSSERAAGERGVLGSGRSALGGRALVAPSILSADFGAMGEACEQVLSVGGDVLHVDVMDGHFVPNLTMGPDMVKGLRRRLPDAVLDVHLMVTDPDDFVEAFAAAGADHISFHVEVVTEAAGLELLERVRGLGCSAGVAINPGTDAGEHVGLVRASEMVVVMGVVPGFSGQKLIPESVETARVVRGMVGLDVDGLNEAGGLVEFDGGATRENAAGLVAAGVDVVVGGSSVFGAAAAERGAAISDLRGEKI